MLILAQTTWAICVVNFDFHRSNNISLWPYKGKIVCTDKAGSGYGV